MVLGLERSLEPMRMAGMSANTLARSMVDMSAVMSVVRRVVMRGYLMDHHMERMSAA